MVDAYSRHADAFATSDDPDKRQSASKVRSLMEWCAALSSARMVRMVTLMSTLSAILEAAIGYSASGGFDDELDRLAVHIDQGYVRQPELANWRELLRNALYEMSETHPIPLLDTWTDDHPFLRTFAERRLADDLVGFNSAFGDIFNFCSSETDTVVRLADVVASVFRRCQIGRMSTSTYKVLNTRNLGSDPFTLIEWTGNTPELRLNPWEEYRR